jgi:hypothetical protein
LRLSAQHLPVRCLALPARQERTVFLLLLRLSWCHGRLWGRIGAADGRNLGDSSGQQGITNLEVSGRLTAIHLRRETAGLGFHTAEARADSFRELCDANFGPMAEATTTPSSGGSSGGHGQQLDRQGVQVDLVPRADAERLDGPGGVVLAAVEARRARITVRASRLGIGLW